MSKLKKAYSDTPVQFIILITLMLLGNQNYYTNDRRCYIKCMLARSEKGRFDLNCSQNTLSLTQCGRQLNPLPPSLVVVVDLVAFTVTAAAPDDVEGIFVLHHSRPSKCNREAGT